MFLWDVGYFIMIIIHYFNFKICSNIGQKIGLIQYAPY